MNTPPIAPPIAGVWVISSEHDLTADTFEHVKDALQHAADTGTQVVTVEGIEFRWKPIIVEPMFEVAPLANALLAHRLEGIFARDSLDSDFHELAERLIAEMAQ